MRLEALRPDHAPEVLAFERANRAYFGAFISDRGDAFFEEFDARFDLMLAEQEAGTCAFHVLVADDGSVLGRFNLFDIRDGVADVGYRVAQRASGQGVATATVEQLARVAETTYGVHTLRAAVADTNVASQRVLTKAGFVCVGPAEPAHVGGKTGRWYERDPTSPQAPGG